MARHVVAAVGEIPEGGRKLVEVRGRQVVVFNVGGSYYALLDRCPHQGGSLACGKLSGLIESSGPGDYRSTRAGEFIRCPWHGWAFDLKTGRSLCEPSRWRARSYPTMLASGAELKTGPYTAETFEVRRESNYVVIDF
jgi:nitrite reductase/ring-hydroxylating ferredoxin subunit